MAAAVIDGKAVAASVRERVKTDAEELTARIGRPPGLATVLVGDDPASAIYVRNKRKASEEVGIRSFHHEPEASISQESLLDLVNELNDSDEIDGILVQLPLPDQIDADAIVDSLDPDKDVDGLTPASAGRLARGEAGLVPCTPRACGRHDCRCPDSGQGGTISDPCDTRRRHTAGLGQEAYAEPDGSLVVRKDFLVLRINTSGLPHHFGQPPLSRTEAARRIGADIMTCWTEH
jgi:hypothetical protein